jgi:hypothetical protein
MTSTRRPPLITVLTAVIAMIGIGLFAPAVHAGNDAAASPLKGTWIGTYSGYSTSGYESGQEKIVITKTKGSNARGTWQYRPSAKEKWSAPKPMTLSVYATEDDEAGEVLYISGLDSEGTYTGKLNIDDDHLVFGYTSPNQDLLTLTLDMRKR